MKQSSLTIRLNTETRVALKRAADGESRTLSAKADLILIEWLRDNGYLSTPMEMDEPKDTQD